jgi:hypothetical protein
MDSWFTEISVFERRGPFAAVFYEGDSVFFEEDKSGGYFRGWIGDVPKTDMVRELGRLLRQLPDEMTFSADNISSGDLGPWAAAYLSLCMRPETANEMALAEFLSCFPSNEIHLIFELFGEFKDPALLAMAHDVDDLGNGEPSEVGIYEHLVERYGPVDRDSWFEKVAAFVRQELASRRTMAEKNEAELRLEADGLYGSADDMSDLDRLVARFGRAIPFGYLAHAILFSPPRSAETTASLLGAWAEVEEPLPRPPNSNNAFVRGQVWPSVDLRFLAWLLQDRQSSLQDLAKGLPKKTRNKLLAKLMRYANQGAIDLANLEKEKAGSQAHYIGLKMRKSQAEFAVSLAQSVCAD